MPHSFLRVMSSVLPRSTRWMPVTVAFSAFGVPSRAACGGGGPDVAGFAVVDAGGGDGDTPQDRRSNAGTRRTLCLVDSSGRYALVIALPMLANAAGSGNAMYIEIGRASCRERVCQYV